MLKIRRPLRILESIVNVAIIGAVLSLYIIRPIISHMRQSVTKPLLVRVTAYRPISRQTDSSPNWTSIGTPAIMGTIAVSQDLLANGSLHYGDIVLLPGIGVYLVNDTMNKRHKKAVDILVYTLTQEKIVGIRRDVKIRRLHD